MNLSEIMLGKSRYITESERLDAARKQDEKVEKIIKDKISKRGKDFRESLGVLKSQDSFEKVQKWEKSVLDDIIQLDADLGFKYNREALRSGKDVRMIAVELVKAIDPRSRGNQALGDEKERSVARVSRNAISWALARTCEYERAEIDTEKAYLFCSRILDREFTSEDLDTFVITPPVTLINPVR